MKPITIKSLNLVVLLLVSFLIYLSSYPSDTVFRISEPSDFSNTTEFDSQKIKVTAYEKDNKGHFTNASWHIEFSEDGTNWSTTSPSWISLSKNSGSKNETIRITAAPRQLKMGEPDAESQARIAVLQGRSSLGSSSSRVDLSMRDYNGNVVSGRSTANCYIVHQAGYYKFPLAYGNAVKNGVTNTEAFYTSVATGFEDADGNTFTASSSPYLADGTYSMEVLWNDMDAPFTLSASSVSVDGVPYAEFYIPQSGIKEGNILIAAKKDGVVKWSWHIWVSGADFTPETITNASGKDYCIMPIDLGWCGEFTSGYDRRICYLRIRTASSVSDKVAVRQIEVPNANIYAVTYYQWGRKDPFIGMGIQPSNNGEIVYKGLGTFDRFYELHRNPIVHLNNYRVARDVSYFLLISPTFSKPWLWNSRLTEIGPIKTIYDPCPAGWTVPHSSAFTGLKALQVKPEGRWWDICTNRKSLDGDEGLRFQRNSSDAEGLYFPCYGGRTHTGELALTGEYGYRWTSVSYGDKSNILKFFPGQSMAQKITMMSEGSGIRPVLEE